MLCCSDVICLVNLFVLNLDVGLHIIGLTFVSMSCSIIRSLVILRMGSAESYRFGLFRCVRAVCVDVVSVVSDSLISWFCLLSDFDAVMTKLILFRGKITCVWVVLNLLCEGVNSTGDAFSVGDVYVLSSSPMVLVFALLGF